MTESPFLVPFDGSLPSFPTASSDTPGKKHCRRALADEVKAISALQRRLFADGRHALLLVFQALDAAGKDGTIRHVLSGVNPAGCRVTSFKQPSAVELDHDFLWRTSRVLPARGMIGVFNRSYYEEVLVVRVHPEFLGAQNLPRDIPTAERWPERYASIREHERHLSLNGTTILKFWLNISREEQRQRLLARLEEPDKYWKFSPADLAERERWDDYQLAFREALSATSRPWAPWYAVPADSKPFARLAVARIVRAALEGMDLRYPEVPEAQEARFTECRRILEAEA